jgi:hypothetical protein
LLKKSKSAVFYYKTALFVVVSNLFSQLMGPRERCGERLCVDLIRSALRPRNGNKKQDFIAVAAARF